MVASFDLSRRDGEPAESKGRGSVGLEQREARMVGVAALEFVDFEARRLGDPGMACARCVLSQGLSYPSGGDAYGLNFVPRPRIMNS